MFIEDIFRPYWAFGLNNIAINNSKTLNEWIKIGNDYQILCPVSETEFELNVFDRKLILAPISKDCNRFSSSALESIIKIDNLNILPKSLSWILIKQYYSAFYSAHLILRTLGFALSQFDSESIKSISKVAEMYCNLNSIKIESGYYLVDYSKRSNTINCKKIKIRDDGGSHVALWKLFGEKLQYISTESLNKINSTEIQRIVAKIDDLVYNLSYVGSSNFSWLSRVRNELNYKHLYGVWHPYSLDKKEVDYITRSLELWKGDIEMIELANLRGCEMRRFSNTCHFIIGLSKRIIDDMSKRCGVGDSFFKSGYNKIINIT
ncbi:hypothetical protein [Aquirufa nivalisilvae]